MKIIKNILKNPLIYIVTICIFTQFFTYKTIERYKITGDSYSYVEGYNQNLLKGKVDSKRTPVYPYFTKAIKKIGGSENLYSNIVAIQKILFIISIILIYFTLKKICKNNIIIILLTLCYGICPSIFFCFTFILTESLTLFEMVVLLYLTISYIKEKKEWQAIFIGITLLIMVMTRPSNIYLPVIYFAFFIFRLLFKPKERKQSILGIVSITMCILIILSYCLQIRKQYGNFGITSVSYVNNFITVLDGDLYKYSDNSEMIEKIDQIKGKETDKNIYWKVLNEMKKMYSDKEIKHFSSSAIKNSRIEYIKYILQKTINLSDVHIGVIYTNNLTKYKNIDYLKISNLVMPINYSTIYILLTGIFIYIIYALFKYKKIDWIISILFLIIVGNIFISIIGAPFETQRLCLITIPSLIVLLGYLFCIPYKEKVDDETINTNNLKDNNFIYRLFIGKTSNIKLQFFRYIFVGGFAAAMNIGTLFILKEFLKIHYLVANIAGFLIGLLTNYIFSKILVFAEEKTSNNILEFILYAIIGIIGLGLDTLFMWGFTEKIGMHNMLSKIVSTGLVFIWNFLGRKGFYKIEKNITIKRKE